MQFPFTNIFEPQHSLLSRYVDSIYIIEKSEKASKYISYPSANTAVGLIRNATVSIYDDGCRVAPTETPAICCIAGNRAFNRVTVEYLQLVDEIAINFRPLGFALFSGCTYAKGEDFFPFTTWNDQLDALFEKVFSRREAADRLKVIAHFLLSNMGQLKDEQALNRAIDLLSDPDNEDALPVIAQKAGVHTKYLYRSFLRYVGCSPAHFRKTVRFRSSVSSKLSGDTGTRLADVCYANDFTDPSYFVKQYREYTGKSPSQFFKEVSSEATNKVILSFPDTV